MSVSSHLSIPAQAEEIGRLLAKHRKALCLTQQAAARQSGISLSMLRRAEARGTVPLPQLLRFASTVGCHQHLEREPETFTAEPNEPSLNQRHPGLVWSNSKAPREVYFRKALLNPRFGQLLKLAKEFGLQSLMDEWRRLDAEFPEATQPVKPEVSRILRNMEAAVASSR